MAFCFQCRPILNDLPHFERNHDRFYFTTADMLRRFVVALKCTLVARWTLDEEGASTTYTGWVRHKSIVERRYRRRWLFDLMLLPFDGWWFLWSSAINVKFFSRVVYVCCGNLLSACTRWIVNHYLLLHRKLLIVFFSLSHDYDFDVDRHGDECDCTMRLAYVQIP